MGSVYLLGDTEQEGIYKIGVTRGDINKRIKKLQTGNSSEIYLVSYYETEHPFLMEKMLHNKYFSDKVLNEWFALKNEEVINFKKSCEEFQNIITSLKDNPFFKKKYGKE
jgi:hypothetical protein